MLRGIVKSDPKTVKQNLADHGVTIRDWALSRGFSEALVYAVLAGKNKATRGESFRIAVALGLKEKPSLIDAPRYVIEALDLRSKSVNKPSRSAQ